MVSMCLLHTYKPTLGGQYGGRPAIYQNQHTDRSASASIWSLPFWQSSFLPLFLGFAPLPPCLCGSGCVYFTTVPHPNGQFVPVCFKQANAKAKVLICVSNSCDRYRSSCPSNFPTHVVWKSQDLNRKKERKKETLSCRLTQVDDIAVAVHKAAECW